jgi:Zn ribbon nucleic-acid-binding protein
MPDELQRFEAALGAIAKITSEDVELIDAICPKCNASDFIQVSDLYFDALLQIEEQPETANEPRAGTVTNEQVVATFKPPKRGSALVATFLTAIPLGVASYFIYRRFGNAIGQLAIILTIIIVVMVLLTSLRRLSDRYYSDRKRWRSLFICRRCGQLVAS